MHIYVDVYISIQHIPQMQISIFISLYVIYHKMLTLVILVKELWVVFISLFVLVCFINLSFSIFIRRKNLKIPQSKEPTQTQNVPKGSLPPQSPAAARTAPANRWLSHQPPSLPVATAKRQVPTGKEIISIYCVWLKARLWLDILSLFNFHTTIVRSMLGKLTRFPNR